VLVIGTARIAMVEHLMAALCALEIDNCIVEIDAEEMPGLDGSAADYVRALREAGLVIQAAPRNRLIVDRTLRVGTASHWIEVAPSPDGRSHYEYRLDYGDDCPIRPQSYALALTPDRFCREVAPARTFVTAQQAAELRASGVAAHVTTADLLVFGHDGPVDNELRFENECARHKALDLIGDLALVGMDLVGRFVSYRGGHNLNAQMAVCLRRLAQAGPEYECRRVA
jgi:UDP-3-O-acyl N-acetylglucosamine deacetylase